MFFVVALFGDGHETRKRRRSFLRNRVIDRIAVVLELLDTATPRGGKGGLFFLEVPHELVATGPVRRDHLVMFA